MAGKDNNSGPLNQHTKPVLWIIFYILHSSLVFYYLTVWGGLGIGFGGLSQKSRAIFNYQSIPSHQMCNLMNEFNKVLNFDQGRFRIIYTSTLSHWPSYIPDQ